MILSPGGVKTNFASNINYLPRHPAYANDPEAPLNDFIKFMEGPSLPATWADPDKCAAVLFDAILGQRDRPLPMRLVSKSFQRICCVPGLFPSLYFGLLHRNGCFLEETFPLKLSQCSYSSVFLALSSVR